MFVWSSEHSFQASLGFDAAFHHTLAILSDKLQGGRHGGVGEGSLFESQFGRGTMVSLFLCLYVLPLFAWDMLGLG